MDHPKPAPSDIARFNQKWRVDADGCHIWAVGKDLDGYGQFSFRGRNWKAHRWIFYCVHGWLPPVVMHRCDKPACVNVNCLTPGTVAANDADRDRKGRAADRRGALCPTAKLSVAQVQDIRDAYRVGRCMQKDLAKLYGVSQSTISEVISGRRFANVETSTVGPL